MNYKKSIGANLLCSLLGAAVVWSVQGGSFGVALLFVLLLLWACNELWCAALTLPGLLLGVWSTLRGKEYPKAEKGVARVFSLLLLVVPHVLFALMYGAESLSGGQVSAWMGMPLSHGLFASAFIAPAFLCLICLVSPLPPLSVLVLGSYLFEPELWVNRESVQSDSTQTQLPPAPEAPENSPHHPELQKLAGELVYYARPVIGGITPYTQRDALVGGIMLAAGLLALAMSAAAYQESSLASVLCLVLALTFGGSGWRLLRGPACWNARLRRVEYAFTSSHVYIVEGDDIQVLPLNEQLFITLEEPVGKIGNIYISHREKSGMPMHVVFRKVKINYDSSRLDTSAPLQGFIQIENAAAICNRLKKYQQMNAT